MRSVRTQPTLPHRRRPLRRRFDRRSPRACRRQPDELSARVAREIELPAGTDPYADAVYQKAADNFAALRNGALTIDDEASVYFYRLQMGGHIQTGLAACFPST